MLHVLTANLPCLLVCVSVRPHFGCAGCHCKTLPLQSPAGAVIPEGRCYVELQVSCVNDEEEAYKVPSVVYRWKQ